MSLRVVWVSIAIAFVTVCSSIWAYYLIFTGFSHWDDEGFCLLSVKLYLSGERLYETIYSCYGPFYYLYNRVLYLVSSPEVTHDHVRFASAVAWVIIPLVSAWMVWRLTHWLAVTTLAYAGILRTMTFLRAEPGHPEELCLLLVIALAASGFLASKQDRRWLAALLAGTLSAALLLVKVNIGGFAILAVGLALLSILPDSRLARVAKYLLGAGAVLAPFVLMRRHLDDPSELAYCAVVTFSIAALLGASRQSPRTVFFSWRHCWIAAGAFAAMTGAVLAIMLAQGISIGNMLYMVVLAQLRINIQQRAWFLALDLHPAWILWGLAGLACAIMNRRVPESVRTLARTLVGGGGLLIAFVPGAGLLGLVAPFCWLLLDPPRDREKAVEYARTLLAFLTVMQSLYAYPLAGSQSRFLRVLLVVVAGTLLCDAIGQLEWNWGRTVRVLAAVGAIALLPLLPVQIYLAKRAYEAAAPLALPGAERIHVKADDAAMYQWLAREVNQNCDTFVGLPGLPSLYLWTRKTPPGLVGQSPGILNEDDWMFLLSDAEQQLVAGSLVRRKGLCAARSVTEVAFWNKTGQDLGTMPLVHYIEGNFKTVASMGEYEFMMPKDTEKKE